MRRAECRFKRGDNEKMIFNNHVPNHTGAIWNRES